MENVGVRNLIPTHGTDPTGRRISREGGKAEGFDGRCRLHPRGWLAVFYPILAAVDAT